MKTLVFGDSHITENSIEELESIFQEIVSIGKNCVTLICLGDFYDKKRPTAKEIMFGTSWAKKFKDIYNSVIFLRGNHELVSEEVSSINYLEKLGIKVVDELKYGKYRFYHLLTDKSDMFFNLITPDPRWYKKIKEFSTHDIIISGHQHCFEKVNNSFYHLGSCRFTSFNEKKVKDKFVSIIDHTNINFIKLQTVIPIFDVFSIEELNKLTKKSKIRYVFNSFEQMVEEINLINKIKPLYHEFKTKIAFLDKKEVIKEKSSKEKNLKEILNNWLNKLENKEVKAELENEFRETLTKEETL